MICHHRYFLKIKLSNPQSAIKWFKLNKWNTILIRQINLVIMSIFKINECRRRYEKIFYNVLYIILLVFFALRDYAGEIVTVNLEKLDGKIQLQQDSVILIKDGERKKFRVNEILDINFARAEFKPQAELFYPKQMEKPYEALPSDWKSQDIGTVRQTGSIRHNIASREPISYYFSVKGAGKGTTAIGDSFYFASVQLKNDFEFIAKVSTLSGADSGGGAGIMARDGLDLNAPFVSIGFNQKAGAVFSFRDKPQRLPEYKTNSNYRVGGWIRLKREGDSFTGYVSADGRKWETVGRCEGTIGKSVSAGLFVYSGKENSLAQARITDVLILNINQKSGQSFIVFKDGSRLLSDFKSFDKNKLNIVVDGKEDSIPLNIVSRIIFHPLPIEFENRILKRPGGAMMLNGDFSEGEIAGLTSEEVELGTRSGNKKYRIKEEVSAVVFAPSGYEPCEYEIYKQDGSVLFTRYLTVLENKIAVDVCGKNLEIPQVNLNSIRRAGGVFQSQTRQDTKKNIGNLASIETTAGNKITGELKIVNNKIGIQKEDGAIIEFGLNEIKQLRINQSETVEDKTGGIEGKISDFSGVDIGVNQGRGRHIVGEDSILIEASSSPLIQSPFDAYYFLQKPIEGDFEMIVRLNQIDDQSGFAGVSVIDSLDRNANGILLALNNGMTVCVRRYSDRQGSVSKIDLRPPVWFKVARDRRRLSAYASRDGKNWNLAFHYEREIPPRLFAGLVAGSGNPVKTVGAYFYNLDLKGAKAKPFKSRLILTSGSEIGCDIISANDSAFRVYTSFNSDLLITSGNIRCVIFDERMVKDLTISEDRRGVLLSNNDFLEADFKKIDGDNLVVSSIILGIRNYRIGETARALFLNNRKIAQTGMEVILVDGGKLICKDVSVKNSALIVKELVTEKPVEIPIRMVLSIKKI